MHKRVNKLNTQEPVQDWFDQSMTSSFLNKWKTSFKFHNNAIGGNCYISNFITNQANNSESLLQTGTFQLVYNNIMWPSTPSKPNYRKVHDKTRNITW